MDHLFPYADPHGVCFYLEDNLTTITESMQESNHGSNPITIIARDRGNRKDASF